MALVRYQPWNSMEQLRREMGRLFEGQPSTEEEMYEDINYIFQ